ncbi:MAG: hypothetical protein F6J87_27925 [Spirulina sp. SIO3F2]|nr:hypothetical protein [Spirulina sp. SIO3F2]
MFRFSKTLFSVLNIQDICADALRTKQIKQASIHTIMVVLARPQDLSAQEQTVINQLLKTIQRGDVRVVC